MMSEPWEPVLDDRVEVWIRGKRVRGTVYDCKGTRYFVRLDKADPQLGSTVRVTVAFLHPIEPHGQTSLL